MRLLHLSDLHLTKGFDSLDDAFLGVHRHLESVGLVDFIVVSGDLSQAATESEYNELLTFAEATLLPLLRDPKDRARVVFVPGNHDVDWSASIAVELAISSVAEKLGPTKFSELLKSLQRSPSGLGHRLSISPHGHVRIHEIDGEKYPRRFARVEKFLRDFYRDALRDAPHKAFQLSTPGQDWSAHVFPADGVAFIGFNSCHENDCYWTGARIAPAAVSAAEKHMKAQASDCRPIAVWHHGIASDEQRPDYLTPADLGRLFGAGFRVGLHGHTHRAEIENLAQMFSGQQFVVVATGSLGAGSDERPGAVGNQFSVVDIHGETTRVRTYERGGKGLVYDLQRDDILSPYDRAPGRGGGTRAREHRRSCTVDEQGIATIEVELLDVHLEGHLVLALLTPPFCGVEPEKEAQTNRGPRKVDCERLPDGRFRCVFSEQTGAYESIRWRYYVSSAFALDADEMRILPKREGWLPKLDDGEQVRPHTVRFWCEQLYLAVSYAGDVINGKPRALVERRTSDTSGGFKRWEPLPSEGARCSVDIEGAQFASLTIHAPQLNCRYGIVHRLRPGQRSLSREGLRWADHLLARCRDAENAKGLSMTLDEAYAKTVDAALRSWLKQQDLREIRWLGFLWNDKRRLLSSAFGSFGRRGWAARFAVGSGVVGHSVRTRHVAAWSPAGDASRTVIYEPRSSDAAKHAWIVAVPLTLGHGGSPVGAVSLWASATDTRASRALEEMAEQDLTGGEEAGVLLSLLNQTFWDTSKQLGVVDQAEWPDVADGYKRWWENATAGS